MNIEYTDKSVNVVFALRDIGDILFIWAQFVCFCYRIAKLYLVDILVDFVVLLIFGFYLVGKSSHIQVEINSV